MHSPGSLNVKPFLNTLQEYGSIYDSLDDHQILIPGPEVDLPWSPDARDPQSEIPVVDSIIPPLSSIFPLWRNSPGPKRNGWRWGDVESFLKLWIWIFNVNSAKLGQLLLRASAKPVLQALAAWNRLKKKKVAKCKCNSFNPPQLYWSLMSLIVWSFLASVASNWRFIHWLVLAVEVIVVEAWMRSPPQGHKKRPQNKQEKICKTVKQWHTTGNASSKQNRPRQTCWNLHWLVESCSVLEPLHSMSAPCGNKTPF